MTSTEVTISRDGLAIVVRRGASIIAVFDSIKNALIFIATGASR